MLESGVAGHIKRFHAVTSHRWHRGHFFFNNLFSGLIGIRMSSWCDKLISGRMLMSGKDHWKHYCEIDVERVPWQRCCTVKRSWRRGLSINSGIKRLHGVTHRWRPANWAPGFLNFEEICWWLILFHIQNLIPDLLRSLQVFTSSFLPLLQME